MSSLSVSYLVFSVTFHSDVDLLLLLLLFLPFSRNLLRRFLCGLQSAFDLLWVLMLFLLLSVFSCTYVCGGSLAL